MRKLSAAFRESVIRMLDDAGTIAKPETSDRVLLELVTEKAKFEVLQDMADGTVPENVPTFSDLHSHVDANCYGSLDRIDWSEECQDDFMEFTNAVQDAIHAWLRERSKSR